MIGRPAKAQKHYGEILKLLKESVFKSFSWVKPTLEMSLETMIISEDLKLKFVFYRIKKRESLSVDMTVLGD